MLRGFERPRVAPKPEPSEKPGQNGTTRARGGVGNANPQQRLRQRVPGPSDLASGQKIPYLNVITNFSKPNPTSTSTVHAPSMVVHRRNESLQERRRQNKVNGGSRGRIESLKAEEPASGLSPSDRELMIGIMIPGPPTSQSKKTHESAKSNNPSPNPEIVITPAEATPPKQLQPTTRGRATSSVYSRFPNGARTTGSAPPVPLISRYSAATSIETSSRCTSWATDFSEDETIQPSRPDSCESQNAILKRKSTDSLATKHRSKGWWNEILTPFAQHFNFSKDIGDEKGGRSSVEDASEGNWKIAKNAEKKQTRIDSVWADLTGRSIAKKADTFFSDPKDLDFNDYPGVHRGALVNSPEVKTPDLHSKGLQRNAFASPKGVSFLGERSPEIIGVQGMGLAAEYFEAYWHDQNSPTPYFTCENHSCSYGRGTSQTGTVAGLGSDNSRGLEGIEYTNEPSLTKFGGAQLGHRRQPSDTTVIEEGEDASPEVENTRAAPTGTPAKSATKALPYPPREDSLASPAVMTPGLRRDFAQHRALPMEPSRKSTILDEPAPRYPPLNGSGHEPRHLAMPEPGPVLMPETRSHPTSEPRGFVEDSRPPPASRAVPMPALSAFSPPSPREHGTPYENVRDLPPYPGPQASHPTAVNQYFGPGGDRGGPHELHDPHPGAFFPPPPARSRNRDQDELNAKEKRPEKKGLKTLFSRRRGPKTKEQKKRRRLFCCIFFALLLMVILIVVLVIELTIPRSDMSVQTQWLNISGYPPVPTGIATIVRPDVQAVDGCVAPVTMWSCALPKEQQAAIAPNPGDQPDFRVEIRFQNGTNLTSNATFSKRSDGADGMTLVQLVRRTILLARDQFTSSLFAPSPAPPNTEDQTFLGNTTDGNHAPFAGEATPFFMSFLPASPAGSSRLLKRQSSINSTNSSDPFPDLGDVIPAPAINPDGTAAAANLYPFPSAQPLMLFDRGRDSEHYGFYTYFDRSIFLKSASVNNISEIGVVPDDENGGSTEDEASLRCTWAQTRFLVQIWTNTGASAPLLSNGTATSTAAAAQATASSSAIDFTPPGSFPYPISITMDRHGGDIDKKSIYCYDMDDREHILTAEKKLQIENRAFGGELVNPALGLFSQVNVSLVDGGPGGIDGGSGGCSCLWRNFQAN